jgi:hypothetical protein
MDLRELYFGYIDWIHLAQDVEQLRALVHLEINILCSINFVEFLD